MAGCIGPASCGGGEGVAGGADTRYTFTTLSWMVPGPGLAALEAAVELARTVLIVEDDPDLRNAFTAVLARHGYAVTAVGDAEAAAEHLARGLPALVVTD